MTKIKVKDVSYGDTLLTPDGGNVSVLSCKKFPLVESAGGTTYEIEYLDGKETGRMLLDGNTTLERA